MGEDLEAAKRLAVHTGAILLEQHTSQWDTCAPHVILHEATGRMTDLRNTALRYNSSEVRNINGLIASNGIVHDRIAKAAHSVFAK